MGEVLGPGTSRTVRCQLSHGVSIYFVVQIWEDWASEPQLLALCFPTTACCFSVSLSSLYFLPTPRRWNLWLNPSWEAGEPVTLYQKQHCLGILKRPVFCCLIYSSKLLPHCPLCVALSFSTFTSQNASSPRKFVWIPYPNTLSGALQKTSFFLPLKGQGYYFILKTTL